MDKIQFNPASMIINLVIGWFFAAILQAAVFALATGGWKDLLSRFSGIAFFKDSVGVLINLAIVIIGGGTGIAVWLLLKK